MVVLVTMLFWWLFKYDRFKIFVTKSYCWRLFLLCCWFLSALNRSTTSQSCNQHISSPTSAKNIDVAINIQKIFQRELTWNLSFRHSYENLSDIFAQGTRANMPIVRHILRPESTYHTNDQNSSCLHSSWSKVLTKSS